MDKSTIKSELEEKGYVVIPDVLSLEEVESAKAEFFDWKEASGAKTEIHGIFKHYGVGNTRHAWMIRTNPKVQQVFADLWETTIDNLIVSQDGSCWIPKECKTKDKIWTHTDQGPVVEGVQCYQGFVALTDNSERSLVVFEGSHKLHKEYFDTHEVKDKKSNWQLLEHDYLKGLEDKRKVLEVKAGSLVLWESRVFHQNQYGKAESEERLVQYVCYMPKDHKKNTKAQQKKREEYHKTGRTTTHWPVGIRVNPQQPRTWGDDSKKIDYDSLPKIDLEDLKVEIMKIL